MTDIDVRISLVEQNYQNLEKRIDKVEDKLDGIKEQMITSQGALIKVIVGTTGTILVALISTIGIILTQMP
jgi:tetrahydromethanopterin S-methyltransferase subunit G